MVVTKKEIESIKEYIDTDPITIDEDLYSISDSNLKSGYKFEEVIIKKVKDGDFKVDKKEEAKYFKIVIESFTNGTFIYGVRVAKK